jgi:hypothetical protein
MLLQKLSRPKPQNSTARKPIYRIATFASLLCSLYAHQTSAQPPNIERKN